MEFMIKRRKKVDMLLSKTAIVLLAVMVIALIMANISLDVSKKQRQEIITLQLDLAELKQHSEAVQTDLEMEVNELKGLVAAGDVNFRKLIDLLKQVPK